MENNTFTNRLIHETSPYLQQHAHNPVNWYPWGEEALEKARREDKPILLSVGYSACHWCHVMEQESFEDEAVAKVMNGRFVCIKVDREERPDLDKIYQTAHQLLTQRPGGWPLNMFLMPDDHMPFFGGTYFPKTPKFGMPGFTEVLQRVADFYHERRKEIVEQSDSLRELFGRIQPDGPAPDAEISDNVLKEALTQLKNQFDPRHGGFGGAPKFPHPTSIEFCLRCWAHSVVTGKPDNEARHIARFTLRAMASGGIYDQIGGGFCRYAVDEQWMIPHFEKMLYDNAQLLPLYADAFLATGDNLFKRVAEETAAWTIREMQSPEGGYYSTLDADSEGQEGKFYVWTTEELKNLLNADEWNVLEARYGLKGESNFEGKWHLHVHAGHADIANKLPYQEADIDALLASAHGKLFAAREKRIRPGRDEKILTSWNGLMIKGMARAGRLLRRQDFIASAERAMDFIRDRLWKNGRLLATYRDVQAPSGEANTALPRDDCMDAGGRATQGAVAEAGSRGRPTAKNSKARLNAYLDDYAFLIDACLELLQTRWRQDDLEFITVLADYMLEHFEDRQQGGFYFTADDHEKLVHRPKPTSDDAIPSGNGIAALVLLRLGHLLGEASYLIAAERTLKTLHATIAQYPSAHGSLLLAIEEHLNPIQTIVLRGNQKDMAAWLSRCQQHYTPRRLTVGIPYNATGLPGVLAERMPGTSITAYVCTGHACSAPVTSLTELESLLSQSEIKPKTGANDK